MKSKEQNIPAVIRWRTSPYVHEFAANSMDHRAKFEADKVDNASEIIAEHGEAVKKFDLLWKYLNYSLLFLKSIGHPIKGKAIDLGSGTGVGAAILSKMDHIQGIFAVEVSEKFVQLVMPLVFEAFEAESSKIQRVIGDFNYIELADESVQLVVAVDSLHHSENLSTTLGEVYRVLHPGGALIAIDRAWHDYVTQDELEQKMDNEFPDHMKLKYGIALNNNFTRRDWGEHEYTFSQFTSLFQSAGFDCSLFYQDSAHVPGGNFILTKLPAFQWGMKRAVKKYFQGQRRFKLYGYAYQQVIFIAVKK